MDRIGLSCAVVEVSEVCLFTQVIARICVYDLEISCISVLRAIETRSDRSKMHPRKKRIDLIVVVEPISRVKRALVYKVLVDVKDSLP